MKFDEEHFKASLIPLLDKIGFAIEGKAKELCPVDTGRLRSSIQHKTIPVELSVVIGTNVEYACVIGSRHNVYYPEGRTSGDIGNYKPNSVLSKDGEPHRIVVKHRFPQIGKNEIEGISIKIKKRRNPLIVTKDHLILTLREECLQWMRANELRLNDMVFRKRSHNAIIDNSNKVEFNCVCGKDFFINKSELNFRKPKYCSQECYYKYTYHDRAKGKKWHLKEEQKGPNHWMWKGGKSFEPYDWRFNNELKKFIQKRDKHTCQSCGMKKNLVIHHIDTNKMNSEISNLTTLCNSCHTRIHRIDCELPDVNLKIFKPIPILELKKVVFKRKNKEKLPNLYDFTIDNENSFVCGGILIHNSYVEFMAPLEHPRPGRETGQMPFLRPAIFQSKKKIMELTKAHFKGT